MESTDPSVNYTTKAQKTQFVSKGYPSSDYIPVGHLVQVPSTAVHQPVYCKHVKN